MIMQKVRISLFFTVLGVILFLSSLVFNTFYTFSIQEIAGRASRQISIKLSECREALSLLDQPDSDKKEAKLYTLFGEKKIGIYLFSPDSLIYWNNAQIPMHRSPQTFSLTQGLAKLRQGYYLYTRSQTTGGKIGIALSRIKSSYDLQNNYLKNTFLSWTGIPKESGILFSEVNGTPVLLDDRPLFFIKGDDSYSPLWATNLATILFMLGFLAMLIAILLLVKREIRVNAFIVLVILVLAVRACMIWFNWPGFLYKSILYDVQLFGDANSRINFYLGDILLNAFTLLFVATSFHFYMRQSTSKAYGFVLNSVILFATTCFIVSQFNQGLKSLVTNSTLDFDFLNIFNIKFPTFIGIVALALYSMALYSVTHKFVTLTNSAKSRKGFLVFLGFGSGACFVQALLQQGTFFEAAWFFVFASSVYLLVKINYSKLSIGLGFQILLMSVITSVLLTFHIDNKQKLDLAVLSATLSERQDPILENEFNGLPEKIKEDASLGNLIQILPNTKNEIEQLLKQKYFSEYFNRYNVDFSLFDTMCNPLLSPPQAVLLDEGFLDEQIRYNSDSTFVPGLFFVKNYKNNSRYIGKIPIGKKKLYVFLEPKQFEEQGSFPDLLLDQSQQKQQEFRNFSYAVYRSGQNTSRYGSFNYPFFILDSTALAKANPDFSHYYFSNDESTQIISQKTKTWTDRFTYNSYVFLFLSIISYCSYFVYAAIFTAQFKNSSLTRRIQSIIIFLLLLVMSAVGITSGILVFDQFEEDNKKQLQEKTGIIINELTSQYKPQEFFDLNQREILNLKLNEYAHLFNTVISLFDKNGYLFNTSQPRLYELGLAASFANPRAFNNLKKNSSSAESVTEMAGNLKYFSLYTPLYNEKKELVGFVNLPYFAKQSDLVNELSGIISALINVYIILFVISILAGLILSGYITQPLQLIKQQIANITLGHNNEKIKWESNDEIGKLVYEYNQMLVKLENSANLLAQSEREGAWREMAKQVAHEIKNPLTPMKLNLQYLQHLMKNNPDDFREKFERASFGIIEQIDSLANIANEFSNFAKLPATQLQTINLAEIISSSVLIFENNKNLSIRNDIGTAELLVRGDRDQCLRVFNNLLKNAVQALEEVNDPLIEIKAAREGSMVKIMFIDNGCGIPESLKLKIFSPNFTTKTTGSGLGLAMVKNIMQGFGGAVSFESEKGKGTVFYLEFQTA